jgi:uncharacterized protein YcbX
MEQDSIALVCLDVVNHCRRCNLPHLLTHTAQRLSL